MAQNFTADWYATTYQGRAAMANAENNDNTLKSNFSGVVAPANLVAGQDWQNTASGHEGRRTRNAANDAWLALLIGDATQKVWVYRNDTCEGWVVDSSVTDKVLALKGGSSVYNVNGGTTAGTDWDTLKFEHNHTVGLHTHSTPNHPHSLATSGTEDIKTIPLPVVVDGGLLYARGPTGTGTQKPQLTDDTNSGGGGTTGSGGSASTGNASMTQPRPTAAIGTMQFPDLS